MIVTRDNILSVRGALTKFKVLALDTETSGLEHHDVPFAVIIACDVQVYYFDERLFPGFWFNEHFVSIFMESVRWVYQNAKFDMRMTSRMGVYLDSKWLEAHDIAVQARIQKNDYFGKKAYSLEAQGKRIGDNKLDIVKKYIEEHNLYEMRKDYFGVEYKVPRYDWVPVEIMQPYAEQDAALTLKLYHHYNKLMDEDDQRVMDMERKLTPIVYHMENLGVCLDVDYTMKAYYHELNQVIAFKDTFKELTGAIFVDSAKSVQKVINYELPLTEKKQPSLTDDVIEEILLSDADAATKEIVSLVREIRHYEKRINTYYVSFLNKKDNNNLIHCTMWQAGTRTGRFSSSDPNLQNVPKEEDSTGPYVVRGCFVPRAGHTFVSMDYSQMEYRMMAAYAGQMDIIERVMAGEDFHKVTADLFGVSRKTAKTLNFAILYGAGVAKLAFMLGVSVAEARRLKYKYFMALPKVEKLVENVIGIGKSRGYVKNWLGRKMKAEPSFAYALPNHLIQGGGADIVKTAMVRIAEEFPDVKMVLQIHDQLVFDMTPDQFVHIPRIKEIMESIWEMEGMKLTVDVSWSNRSLAERDMQKGLPSAG